MWWPDEEAEDVGFELRAENLGGRKFVGVNGNFSGVHPQLRRQVVEGGGDLGGGEGLELGEGHGSGTVRREAGRFNLDV